MICRSKTTVNFNDSSEVTVGYKYEFDVTPERLPSLASLGLDYLPYNGNTRITDFDIIEHGNDRMVVVYLEGWGYEILYDARAEDFLVSLRKTYGFEHRPLWLDRR